MAKGHQQIGIVPDMMAVPGMARDQLAVTGLLHAVHISRQKPYTLLRKCSQILHSKREILLCNTEKEREYLSAGPKVQGWIHVWHVCADMVGKCLFYQTCHNV
jgi:hypothetical protein